jgi:tetratricopeptide (TPR) repeat protein
MIIRFPNSGVGTIAGRRLLAGALVLIGGFITADISCAQQEVPPPLHGLFEAGVAAEKYGRLDEAEKDFQQILRQGGKVASVYNNLGIVYQLKKDHGRAIAQFRQAIRLQHNYLAPHILLGASLLATDQVPESIEEFELAVNLDPKQVSAREQLARAYQRADNLAGMLDQYRALRQLEPENPEYAYQTGEAYLSVAAWCLEQMKRLDPQSPRVYESRAEAYRAQGQIPLAIRAFQKSAEFDPNLPGIHLALAQIYLEQGKIEDARHEIELELAVVPESAAARKLQQQINSEISNH